MYDSALLDILFTKVSLAILKTLLYLKIACFTRLTEI